jgi:hypothetical protein
MFDAKVTMRLRKDISTASGILIAVVLLVGNLAYRSRLRIEAKIWHLRFGNALVWAHYEVPVPDNWLVLWAREDNDAQLIDTRPKRTTNQQGRTNTLSIIFTPDYHADIEEWKSRYEQLLKERGMKDISDSILQTKNESVSCVTMLVPDPSPNSPDVAVAIQCKSAGGLFMTFTGNEEGLPEFYSFVSQIRWRQSE